MGLESSQVLALFVGAKRADDGSGDPSQVITAQQEIQPAQGELVAPLQVV